MPSTSPILGVDFGDFMGGSTALVQVRDPGACRIMVPMRDSSFGAA